MPAKKTDLELPDTPPGYRWKVRKYATTSLLLSLQKKRWGLWWTVTARILLGGYRNERLSFSRQAAKHAPEMLVQVAAYDRTPHVGVK